MIKKNYTNGTLANTVYSWTDAFETKVISGGGTESTSYYFVNNELVAKKDNSGNKTYIHPDHLGSASLVTNAGGTLVENTTYDAWGEVLSGATKSKFQYTGQEKDLESGLNYYNARYYDSHIRRFTQPDDVVQNIYDPQNLNRYSYVNNNPLRYTDPSGRFVFAIPLAYIAVTAAVTAVAVYFATPPGQTAVKTTLTAAVNGAKNIASAIGNAVSNAAKSISSNKAANSPPPNTSNPANNSSPKNPIGGLIGGLAGAAGQQIQVHGNDLRSTVTTWGYTLKNAAGEIVKYGQSINPENRYSQTWLDQNGYKLFPEISGSKMDMRIWEHLQIGNYLIENGQAPLLNDITRSVNVFR